MKKIFLIVFVLMMFSAYSYSKNKPETKCRKQTVPFVVDGHTNDWKTDALLFDTKTGFAYAFSNDSRFLFIKLKMLDANVQRKALLTGLTIWIDPRGKGKHVLGIVYPQGRMRRPSGRQNQPTQHPGTHQLRHSGQHRLTAEQIRLFNKRYASVTPQFKGFEKKGLTGENHIRVLLQMDSLGHVVYEAKVPLHAIFADTADYLSRAKPFSITLETGYIQLDMSQMQGRGMGRGMGMGMGGGQRPDPSRMAMMQSMTEPSRLKIKTVKLYQWKKTE